MLQNAIILGIVGVLRSTVLLYTTVTYSYPDAARLRCTRYAAARLLSFAMNVLKRKSNKLKIDERARDRSLYAVVVMYRGFRLLREFPLFSLVCRDLLTGRISPSSL